MKQTVFEELSSYKILDIVYYHNEKISYQF